MSETKRGPGAPPGPRASFWICEAIGGCTCGGAKLISERILSTNTNPVEHDAAVNSFVEKHNIEPDTVHGPMYDKKGGQNKLRRKKAAIDRSNLSDIKFSAKGIKSATYDNWSGVAHYIDGDDDNMFFIFINDEAQDGKKRTVPAPGKISREELQFNEELSDDNDKIEIAS